jgi:hypothetical protein
MILTLRDVVDDSRSPATYPTEGTTPARRSCRRSSRLDCRRHLVAQFSGFGIVFGRVQGRARCAYSGTGGEHSPRADRQDEGRTRYRSGTAHRLYGGPTAVRPSVRDTKRRSTGCWFARCAVNCLVRSRTRDVCWTSHAARYPACSSVNRLFHHRRRVGHRRGDGSALGPVCLRPLRAVVSAGRLRISCGAT